MQRCLQYGDHFLFEDAIGRKKSLPCDQFQHWDVSTHPSLSEIMFDTAPDILYLSSSQLRRHAGTINGH
jgi:hypothetical protein